MRGATAAPSPYPTPEPVRHEPAITFYDDELSNSTVGMALGAFLLASSDPMNSSENATDAENDTDAGIRPLKPGSPNARGDLATLAAKKLTLFERAAALVIFAFSAASLAVSWSWYTTRAKSARVSRVRKVYVYPLERP